MELKPFDYKNFTISIPIEIQSLGHCDLKIEETLNIIYGDNKYQKTVQGNASFLRSAKSGLSIQYCQDAIGAIFRSDNSLETAVLCDGVTCTVAPAQTASMLTMLFLKLYQTGQWFPHLKPVEFYKKLHVNLKSMFREPELVSAIESSSLSNEEKESFIFEIQEGNSGSSTLLAGMFFKNKAYFHSYGDSTILVANEEELLWYDRKMSGRVRNNCPDQFSLLGSFESENLWTREVTLPIGKPSIIVLATDGFEENYSIQEVMMGMKDFANKLKPVDITNEILRKQIHTDDVTLACVRIVP